MQILIASFNVGAGHAQAAKAIRMALRTEHPQVTVDSIDVLHCLPWASRMLFSTLYLSLIRRCPDLWGMIYKKTDNLAYWRRSQWGSAFARATHGRLLRVIRQKDPDLVVSTHFLELDLLAREFCLPRRRTLACVITDFEAHSCWLNPNVNLYFVANDRVRRSLASRGIPLAHIHVTGIPIDPQFSLDVPRSLALRRFGLNQASPVVAVLGGGLGLGPMEKVMSELDQYPRPLQVVCAVGKNAKLKKRLEGVIKRQPAIILGYLDNMHELLQAADVIVTKPGGLTISEALARRCPMILINSISGQEAANSDYLLEHGAATKVNRIADIQPLLEEVLGQRLTGMQEACRKIGRPRAAFAVADVLADFMPSGTGLRKKGNGCGRNQPLLPAFSIGRI